MKKTYCVTKEQVENKIKNLKHELDYTKKVYPGYTKKINQIKSKINYYKKKLSSY